MAGPFLPELPDNQGVTIESMITEVRYEISQRDTVYPRLLSHAPERRAVLERHYRVLQGVLRDLLQRKAALEAQQLTLLGGGQ